MARTAAASVGLSEGAATGARGAAHDLSPGVLMVVGSYHPEISGGGSQCRTLVQALKERVGFTVLATTRDPTLPLVEPVDGIPVHRLYVNLSGVTGKMRALVRLARLYLTLRKRFDIVHLHGFTRKSLPLVWLARWTGKRTIYKMTSVGADDAITAGRGWLAARTLRTVDRVVSVSPRLTEQYSQAGLPAPRLAFVPNAVDIRRFHPVAASRRPGLRATLGLPADPPLVAFIGFFSREKAPQLLVEAWCRARTQIPHPPGLLLIGATNPAHVEVDPEVVADLQRRLRAQWAEGEARFVEKTHDVPTFLQASDIFVLPSLREGFPNALLEAMATGLACVASRLQGVTDAIIEDGVNGLLVAPGDTAALERALLLLLRDPARALELGTNARRTVEERYSIAQTASRMLAIYHSLMPLLASSDEAPASGVH